MYDLATIKSMNDGATAPRVLECDSKRPPDCNTCDALLSPATAMPCALCTGLDRVRSSHWLPRVRGN